MNTYCRTPVEPESAEEIKIYKMSCINYTWTHCTPVLTSPLPFIPWHQALSLAFCCLAQMGQWIPNEPVELQPGIHYQRKTRCDPHQPLSSTESNFKKVHKSELLSSEASRRVWVWRLPWCYIWVKARPFCSICSSQFAVMMSLCQRETRSRNLLVHLSSTCVTWHSPTPTHKHTYGLLGFNSPSNIQYAHMHRSTKAKEPDSYVHKHLALQWAPLTDCGEGGAVMQRQGPDTGLHAHSLGIIASNPHAHWFWQAQGWAITACCGLERLCWTMTTQWLLLCTSDSHHTNNSQTQATTREEVLIKLAEMFS